MCDNSNHQRAESPPTYQVYETKDGRLVNRTLKVEYPNQSNGKLFDGYIWKPLPSELPIQTKPSSKNLNQTTDSMKTSAVTTKFIGPATYEAVNENLLLYDCILFYALPDFMNSENHENVPSKLPLILAFRSFNAKTYHLRIERQSSRWWIKFPNGSQKYSFSTIQNFIEHFYIHGFQEPSTPTPDKVADIFSLNLLENISE